MGKDNNNLTAKIFALIISIILWSYVMSVENPYINREYRDVVVNLYSTSELERQGLVVMEPEEVKIKVEVRGKKSDMNNFSASNIVAEIDLKGYEEGQSRIGVDVSLTSNLSNISIVDYEPKEVVFLIDKIITKEKTVGVEIEGEVDGDYILGEITSKPDKVLIRGPRTWVDQVSEIKAVANVTGASSDINTALPIQINDANGNEIRGLEKEPTVVDINIPVLRKHTLPIEFRTEGSLPEGYSINDIKINPNSVAIKGDDNIINHSHINTKVVKMEDLLDKTSIEVELDLPEDIELLNPNEKVTVSYVIEKVEEKDIEFDIKDLDIRNLKDDLITDLDNLNNNIKLEIKGSQEKLANIKAEDFKVYIDLKDLEEGSHEVDIDIEKISGIDIKSIDPKRLKLNLKLKDEDE